MVIEDKKTELSSSAGNSKPGFRDTNTDTERRSING